MKYLLTLITLIVILPACNKKHEQSNLSVEQMMQDPKMQDEVMQYIMNDYPMMMDFLDHCVQHDQATSMMMGHRKMMNTMMCNTEMMIEVMKKDTNICPDMTQNVMQAICTDSVLLHKMQKMIQQQEAEK